MLTNSNNAFDFVTIFIVLVIQWLHSASGTTFTGSSNISCLSSEKKALLEFKRSLIDDSNRLSSWNGDYCCAWHGVWCSRQTGYVVKLDLRNPFSYLDADTENYRRNSLRGELNISLRNLKHLTYLDLSLNKFSNIPDFIGSLTNLRYLNLSTASLAGKIPHTLGNLSLLQHLDLSDNYGLQDVDDLRWLSKLHSLKHLDLSNIDLSKSRNVFTALNMLPSLLFLNLGHCRLDYIPVSASFNFTSLVSLDLSGNIHQTSTVPHWLSNLTDLVKLNLHGNKYDGLIPESIGMLRSLTFLDLSDNSFTNLLPNTLAHLGNLLDLELSSNKLQVSISGQILQNQTILRTMSISDNMLQGSVPTKIGDLRNLVRLDLSHNELEGPIPAQVSNLRNLVYLDLSNNGLKGPIPSELSTLKILDYVDISRNELEGPIPGQIFNNFTQLKTLLLSGNKFRGPIPTEMSNLTELKYLYLGHNKLTGNLLPTFHRLSFLEELYIGSNVLSGTIPLSVGQLPKLQELDLGGNVMTGVVSENIFHNLTMLKSLYMGANTGLVLNFSSVWDPPFQLQNLDLSSCVVGPRFPNWLRNQKDLYMLDISNGSIADNIPEWTLNVQDLDLSENKITGNYWLSSISPKLERLSVSNNLLSRLMVANGSNDIQNFSLTSLHASNNLLVGGFQTLLCNLTTIEKIDLSNNQLSGRLPPCVGRLENLQALDLTNNSLSGKVPSPLGSLSVLGSLHLRGNMFRGELPSTFQNLTSLLTLDMAENTISGMIPPWIGESLSNLKILSLQSNKFHGAIPPQLCQLSSLQLLNLAGNNISGSIPSCLSNLTAMVSNQHNDEFFIRNHNVTFYYGEKILEYLDGMQREYSTSLPYLISIDLSNNNIVGVIPKELMDLLGLIKLNVSGNHINGLIPDQIGNLRELISLDLSRNMLSGRIPPSLSNLSFLTRLNLSFNDLSGKIPTGQQLQTLTDQSIYMGNDQLCGLPILKKCPGELGPSDNNHKYRQDDEEDEDDYHIWLYSGMGPGFLVGFLGFCGSLHFSRTWRYTYYRFLENVFNWLVVQIAVKTAWFRRLQLAGGTNCSKDDLVSS